MNTLTNIKTTHVRTLLLGTSAILLAIAIVTYPDEAFNASLKGLKIWWDIIFPALLPFFITSEILLGFGVVHFMGVLLEPLMKPLFRVPGAGAFVLAMGFASGYPMGAKLATRLREQRLISRIEGERLVSFTTTSDPLFIFGAIAVGFFHDEKLGVIIAFIHYTSSIIVGLIMRFYKANEKINTMKARKKGNIVIRAFKEMHQARLNDGRKFGKLMGDAVMSSIETLLMIGGFIMVFSVILAILTKIQFTLLLAKFITLLLLPFGISSEFAKPIIHGLFEVTLGAKSVSEVSVSLPFIQKIAVVSAISAWSGISVHAQVAALLQKTDIKYTPFLFARIAHSFTAFVLTFILWKPLHLNQLANHIPTFMYRYNHITYSYSLWDNTKYLSIFGLFILGLLIILSIGFHLFNKNNKTY